MPTNTKNGDLRQPAEILYAEELDALIKADKHFQLMFYPNKTHGIAGKAARTHLFQMIEEHFEHELK